MTVPEPNHGTSGDGFVVLRALADACHDAEYAMSRVAHNEDMALMETIVARIDGAFAHPSMANPDHDVSSFADARLRAIAHLEMLRCARMENQ